MARSVGATNNLGLWMTVVGAVGGTVNAILAYFSADDGIHGTWGALGVLVASALIALFSLLIALDSIRPLQEPAVHWLGRQGMGVRNRAAGYPCGGGG